MNETIELMRRHRSIRRFKPREVPSQDIRRAVEAGQYASTSSGVQAYSVIHVTDPPARRSLVPLTGGQEKVADAGAFLIICGDMRRHRLLGRRAGLPHDAKLEAFMLAVIDASLLAQNMALAFESMGYGVCYIGGLRNELPKVDSLLSIPKGVYPLYGMCIGVPDEEPLHRPRLPVEAVLFENQYPEDDAMLETIDAYDTAYRAYMRQRDGVDRDWSSQMAKKFSQPAREALAPYYRSKGATFE